MDWTDPLTLGLTLGSILLGLIAGVLLQKFVFEKQFQSKEKKILDKLAKDKRTLKIKQKEFESDIRNDLRRSRNNWDKEKKKSKSHIMTQLNQAFATDKESTRKNRYFDSQITELQKKIDQTSLKLKESAQYREEKAAAIQQIEAQKQESSVSLEEAKSTLQSKLEKTIEKEMGQTIETEFNRVQEELTDQYRLNLAQEIKTQAKNFVTENAILSISLSDDKMKGQIIGREGRNIRSFETITGTNIIIDETPSTILISGFDPIRKEIAKETIEQLLKEGKINPQKIEEVYLSNKNKVINNLKEKGFQAAKRLELKNFHPEVLRLIGKLSYHTYQGKTNLLQHIEDTVLLADSLSKDLEENPIIPKRAIFIHQLGRSLAHQVPGNIHQLTLKLAKKYNESEDIFKCLNQYQDWTQARTPYALITALSIEIANAKPGSLTETLKNYLLRQSEIETLLKEEKGIKKCYAYITGHHTRVWAASSETSEEAGFQISREFCHRVKEKTPLKGITTVVISFANKNFQYSL